LGLRDFRIIIVSGFICTGSSYLISVLRGVKSFYALNDEFNLFNPEFNLYELIKSIESKSHNKEKHYNIFRNKILQAGKTPTRYSLLIQKIKNRLVPLEHQGTSGRYSFDKAFVGQYYPITRSMLANIKEMMNSNDHNENLRIKISNIITTYINRLLNTLDVPVEKDTVLLNQTIKPDQNTEFGLNVLKSSKLIVMDRDPRDQYIDLKYQGRLNSILTRYGKNSGIEIRDYIDWYRYRREIFYTNIGDIDRLLVVKFENLVLKYDDTIRTILSFLGMNSNEIQDIIMCPRLMNTYNKVGMWKSYQDKNAMKRISSELKIFCNEL
jgi:hypothetical protein